MTITKKLWYYVIALLGAILMLMLLNSCEKEEKNVPVLTTANVTTSEVTVITQTTAKPGGNITDDGGATITERGVCWSTSQNPTINDSKTEDGTWAGSFTSNIIDLEPNSKHYLRAYATNSEGAGYGNIISFTTLHESYECIDVDGNVYESVVIGTQVWMAENLRVTKFNNGDPILTGLDNSLWFSSTEGAFAIYPHTGGLNPNEPVEGINSDEEMVEAYGLLYNWYAVVDNRGLCPIGWHVPSYTEWDVLSNYVGGYIVSGYKLKSSRISPDEHPRWESSNNVATNEYGFAALPGGTRSNYNSDYVFVGSYGVWWTKTRIDNLNAKARLIYYKSDYLNNIGDNMKNGYSIRCVKD